MKTTVPSLAFAAGCCLGLFAVPMPGHSQHFYFDAQLGGALSEDVKLREFLVPTPGTELKLYAGPRLSVAGGYNFNDFVGLQLETGFIYNEVKSVSGPGHIDGSLSHVPLLADVVVRYDRPDCNFVPYIGAGVGGDASLINIDHSAAPNGAIVDGSEGDVVFAWQVFAGLRYRISSNMSIGGGYKFFYADGASWNVQHSAGDIRTDKAHVHSLGFDFNITF